MNLPSLLFLVGIAVAALLQGCSNTGLVQDFIPGSCAHIDPVCLDGASSGMFRSEWAISESDEGNETCGVGPVCGLDGRPSETEDDDAACEPCDSIEAMAVSANAEAKFKTTQKADDKTLKNGVRIYEDRAENKYEDDFTVDIPATGQINLMGALTVSRCNEKDINGKSGDGKSNPCYSVCGKGGNLKNCYPETKSIAKKWNKDFFDPTFHAKIFIPGHEKACDSSCNWQKVTCMKEMHHCSLSLSGCTCDAEKGWKAKLIVTASTEGVKTEPHYVVELEKGKGYLAAYGGKVEKSEKETGLLNGKQFKAEMDPDKSSWKPTFEHVIGMSVPNANGQIVVARAEFDIKLNWDAHKSNGKPDSCNPLVGTQLLLSSGKLSGSGTKSNKKIFSKNIFQNKITQNCLFEKSSCSYIVEEVIDSGALPKNPYVTLTINVHKSCVKESKDTWEIKSGFLQIDILS